MAHTVTFSSPERSLGKADLEFKVKRNGVAFGTLKVSKGAVVWVPANAQRGYRLAWRDLDSLMLREGKRE